MIMQHVVFGIKILIGAMVSDVPPKVMLSMRRVSRPHASSS